jgi:hypothetical protein
MRPTSTWLLTLTLLCGGTQAAPARAQDATEGLSAATEGEAQPATEVVTEAPGLPDGDALAFNAEILDEVLTRSAQQTIREEKFAAAAGITGGMIMLGLATWRLIEDDPQSQYSRGLGVMFMTLGMADLTIGVYAATRIPHEKRRLDRWKRARKDGITDIGLAHFEGELEASHDVRQGERLFVRWTGLTHALAGLMVLAYTPIPDSLSQTDRVSGYVIAGLFFAVGVGTFAASFRDTPSEKAWKEYNTRKKPMPGHEFQWGVAPSVSRQGAGISFGGAF